MRLSDRIKINKNICQIADLALLPKKDNNPSRRRKIGLTRLTIPIELSKSESLTAVIQNPHDVSFRKMYLSGAERLGQGANRRACRIEFNFFRYDMRSNLSVVSFSKNELFRSKIR